MSAALCAASFGWRRPAPGNAVRTARRWRARPLRQPRPARRASHRVRGTARSASTSQSMKTARDKNQDGLIPRAECLQRDDSDEHAQPPPGQLRDPAFHRHQRERNPEGPDHMEVPVALMHSVKAERKDEPGHGRCEMVAREPPRQRVRRERSKQERQQPDEVVGEDRISGQRVHRQGEEADAEQVLAVRQRVRRGIEDVGVKQRREPVEPHVIVPGQRPDDEPGIATVTRRGEMGEIADRCHHHRTDDRVQDHERGTTCLPPASRFSDAIAGRHRGTPSGWGIGRRSTTARPHAASAQVIGRMCIEKRPAYAEPRATRAPEIAAKK